MASAYFQQMLAIIAAGAGGGSSSNRVGVNLNGILYYLATHEYVDLMRQAYAFGPPGDLLNTAQEDMLLDPVSGWPERDWGVNLWAAQETVPGLNGTYALSFTGPSDTVLTVTGATVGSSSYDAGSGVHQKTLVVPENPGLFSVTFTNTAGLVRDVKVIRPGYSTSSPPTFTSTFLSHIAPFKVLRFMDWMETNSPDVATTWATRPTIANKKAGTVPGSGIGAGQPWERAIELSNTTNSDMWINIPMGADDNYVEQLAALISATLSPSLKVYVEYSNEVWNPMFPQFTANKNAADAALLADPKTTLIDYDGQSNAWYLAYRFFAERTKQISQIFSAEFGSGAMMTRIRPVLAWQAASPGPLADMLGFIRGAYGPPSSYFYAIAGAPYFAMGSNQTVDGLTTTQVLDALEASVAAADVDYLYEFNAAVARKHGLKWLAYEGGPDTFGSGSQESKAQANREARMHDMCITYLDDWNKAGGELFMWFTAGAGAWNGSGGSWTLVENIQQTNTPKLLALLETNAAPAPAFDGRLKTNVDIDTANTADGYNTGNRVFAGAISERDYLVDVDATGTFSLSISVVWQWAYSTSLYVLIDGVQVLEVPLTQVGTDTPVTQVCGNVSLAEGAHAVTLRTVDVTGSGSVLSFKLTPA